MVAGGLGEINAIKDRLERARGNASRTTEKLNKIKAALWRAYRTAKYEDTKAKQDVLDAEKALREAEKNYNLVEVGINNEKKTNCTGKKRDVSELSLTIDEEGTRTPRVSNLTQTASESSLPLQLEDVNAPVGLELVLAMSPPQKYDSVICRGIFQIMKDGSHSCSGNWAFTFDKLSSCSFHFGLTPKCAAEGAKTMLERMKTSGAIKNDDRKRNVMDLGSAPSMLQNVTFPIDSAMYRGSFKMKMGVTEVTVKDEQIILKFARNTSGGYNVYGRGINCIGTYNIEGTLVLQGGTSGHLILYRLYPPRVLDDSPHNKLPKAELCREKDEREASPEQKAQERKEEE